MSAISNVHSVEQRVDSIKVLLSEHQMLERFLKELLIHRLDTVDGGSPKRQLAELEHFHYNGCGRAPNDFIHWWNRLGAMKGWKSGSPFSIDASSHGFSSVHTKSSRVDAAGAGRVCEILLEGAVGHKEERMKVLNVGQIENVSQLNWSTATKFAARQKLSLRNAGLNDGRIQQFGRHNHLGKSSSPTGQSLTKAEHMEPKAWMILSIQRVDIDAQWRERK